MKNNISMILASASPRRRELLGKLQIPFEVEASHAEEIIPEGLAVEKTAEYLSGIKAEDIFSSHNEEDIIVIGSDTIVVLDGVIFGKPRNHEDAFRMLKTLSGRTHEVMTGVTILLSARKSCFENPEIIPESIGQYDMEEKNGQPETDSERICRRYSFTSVTKVRFYDLSDEEIENYIASGEPMDKAGAYGIQDLGSLLVEGIEGDYFTVVGFPLAKVGRLLRKIR